MKDTNIDETIARLRARLAKRKPQDRVIPERTISRCQARRARDLERDFEVFVLGMTVGERLRWLDYLPRHVFRALSSGISELEARWSLADELAGGPDDEDPTSKWSDVCGAAGEDQ